MLHKFNATICRFKWRANDNLISRGDVLKLASATDNPTSPIFPPSCVFYDAIIRPLSWLKSVLATSATSIITLHRYNVPTLTAATVSETTCSAARRLIHSWLVIIHLPRHLHADILTDTRTRDSKVLGDPAIILGH